VSFSRLSRKRPSEPADWDPNWDEDAAAELIGKLVLIGLTQLNASGTGQ